MQTAKHQMVKPKTAVAVQSRTQAFTKRKTDQLPLNTVWSKNRGRILRERRLAPSS